jgi:hypothetical protein
MKPDDATFFFACAVWSILVLFWSFTYTRSKMEELGPDGWEVPFWGIFGASFIMTIPLACIFRFLLWMVRGALV